MLRFVWYSPSDARRRRLPAVQPSDILHRVYADHIWLSPFLYMRISAALSRLLWPLIVIVLSLRWTARHGAAVRARTGKSLWRQMQEQRAVASASSVLPLRYYQNELFDDALRPRAGEYILFHELKTVLYGLIKMHLPADHRESLKQKDLLAAACHRHKLPAAALVLAMSDRQATAVGADHRALPPRDLFIKPRIGKGGRGAERWIYNNVSDTWRRPDGRTLDRDGLQRHIETLGRAPGVIVQQLLHNHPGLVDLSPGALITARVVTQISRAGTIEVTAAILRLPRSAHVSVDNVVHGGIACEIGLDDGRLGPAADYRQAAAWYDTHPTTGGRIAGRILPYWPETLALVQRAHVLLAPDRGCIGWDIGQCPDGPYIVEANVACDLDFMQRALRRPLGNERVGELFAFHLLRAERGEPPLLALFPPPGVEAGPGGIPDG